MSFLAGAATKVAGSAVAKGAAGAATKGAAGAAAKGAAGSAFGKLGEAFGKIQEFSQPGGAARKVGGLIGDESPLGQGLSAFGNSFDPTSGQFNIGALFDEKQRTELQSKREIIDQLFAELGQGK